MSGDELAALVAAAGALPVPVEIQQECDQLRYWWHVFPPLDMQEVHEDLVEGYIETAGELAEARRAHDHDRAQRLFAELRDLTMLCAASCDGRDAARSRWLASCPPRIWPLGGAR